MTPETPGRAVVIVNPISGRGRRSNELQALSALATDVLGAHGIDATTRMTDAPGDARRLAQEAADGGAELVVAWGGDGTVNEVGSALVGRRIPLAIVPAGSGNGLASDLALPFDAPSALAVAASGSEFTIDAGQIHDALFFNIAGVGVDAVIAARFAERGLRRGRLAYLRLGVAELMRYRAQTYGIAIDGQRTDYRAMLLAMANGRQYGNRVCIAPGARLDDGLLELVIVEELSTVSIALRLPALFRGRLRPGRGVTMRAVRELTLSSDAPIPFHADGEPRLGPSEIKVVVHPAALTVRVPRSRSSFVDYRPPTTDERRTTNDQRLRSQTPPGWSRLNHRGTCRRRPARCAGRSSAARRREESLVREDGAGRIAGVVT